MTAKAGDATATANVVVRGPQPTTIQPDPPTFTTTVGGTQQVNAQVMDDLGQPMQAAQPVWTSADPGIATVTPTGLVTGIRRGNTTITAAAAAAQVPVNVGVK